MTPSQHATLTPTPEPQEKKPLVNLSLKRWITPTTVIVGFCTIINVLTGVMVLGSMQQIYKQVNTLTDFTGSCVMNEYTNKKPTNAPAPVETPAAVVAPTPAQKPAVVTPKPGPGTKTIQQSLPPSTATQQRLLEAQDIINKQ